MVRTLEELIKAQNASEISPVEARDALLGCFVKIHGETLKSGAKILGKDLTSEEVENHALGQMLLLMGDKFYDPTKESLVEVKPKLDEIMNFSKIDPDLKMMHDEICQTLISKIKP